MFPRLLLFTFEILMLVGWCGIKKLFAIGTKGETSLSMLHYPTLQITIQILHTLQQMDNNAISPESRSLFSFCLSTDNKNCHTYKNLNVVKRQRWCLNCCKKELDYLNMIQTAKYTWVILDCFNDLHKTDSRRVNDVTHLSFFSIWNGCGPAIMRVNHACIHWYTKFTHLSNYELINSNNY